jgi:hypothetical protein
MSTAQVLVGISVILFVVASPPYIIDTLHRKTRPERATWFIWTVLGLVAFISQVKLGATWSVVYTGLDTLGSVTVFFLSIRYGVGGWTLLDKIALIIAAVGVFVSLLAHQPVIALLGVITADVSGSVLTIRKTFLAPNSETTITWLLVGTGALCGLIAVGRWNLGLMLYPAYLTLSNYAVPVTQLASRARPRLAQHKIG